MTENKNAEDRSRKVRNIHNFNYCPYCGSKLRHENEPIRAVEVNGEMYPTKYNDVTIYPEHEELY